MTVSSQQRLQQTLSKGPIGHCYRDAQGTVEDRVRAYRWLALAADYGHREAGPERDALGDKLSKQELAKAQRKVEEFEYNH